MIKYYRIMFEWQLGILSNPKPTWFGLIKIIFTYQKKSSHTARLIRNNPAVFPESFWLFVIQQKWTSCGLPKAFNATWAEWFRPGGLNLSACTLNSEWIREACPRFNYQDLLRLFCACRFPPIILNSVDCLLQSELNPVTSITGSSADD